MWCVPTNTQHSSYTYTYRHTDSTVKIQNKLTCGVTRNKHLRLACQTTTYHAHTTHNTHTGSRTKSSAQKMHVWIIACACSHHCRGMHVSHCCGLGLVRGKWLGNILLWISNGTSTINCGNSGTLNSHRVDTYAHVRTCAHTEK